MLDFMMLMYASKLACTQVLCVSDESVESKRQLYRTDTMSCLKLETFLWLSSNFIIVICLLS